MGPFSIEKTLICTLFGYHLSVAFSLRIFLPLHHRNLDFWRLSLKKLYQMSPLSCHVFTSVKKIFEKFERSRRERTCKTKSLSILHCISGVLYVFLACVYGKTKNSCTSFQLCYCSCLWFVGFFLRNLAVYKEDFPKGNIII